MPGEINYLLFIKVYEETAGRSFSKKVFTLFYFGLTRSLLRPTNLSAAQRGYLRKGFGYIRRYTQIYEDDFDKVLTLFCQSIYS